MSSNTNYAHLILHIPFLDQEGKLWWLSLLRMFGHSRHSFTTRKSSRITTSRRARVYIGKRAGDLKNFGKELKWSLPSNLLWINQNRIEIFSCHFFKSLQQRKQKSESELGSEEDHEGQQKDKLLQNVNYCQLCSDVFTFLSCSIGNTTTAGLYKLTPSLVRPNSVPLDETRLSLKWQRGKKRKVRKMQCSL